MLLKILIYILRPILPFYIILFHLRKLYIKLFIYGFWICLLDGLWIYYNEKNVYGIIIALCIGILPFSFFLLEKAIEKNDEKKIKQKLVINDEQAQITNNNNNSSDNEDDDVSKDLSDNNPTPLLSFFVMVAPFWLYLCVYGIYDYYKNKQITVLVISLVLFVIDTYMLCTKKHKKFNNKRNIKY